MHDESRNYAKMIKAILNGKVYVDKEFFVDKAVKLINECKQDCFNQDEVDGMNIAIRILQNM